MEVRTHGDQRPQQLGAIAAARAMGKKSHQDPPGGVLRLIVVEKPSMGRALGEAMGLPKSGRSLIEAKDQFEVVARLLNRVDITEVITATDAGRDQQQLRSGVQIRPWDDI